MPICTHCGLMVPGEELFTHAETCKKPLTEEEKIREELLAAYKDMNVSISWLENGAGTHLTVDCRKLLRLFKAISKL